MGRHAQPHPIPYRELRSRLAIFGVTEIPNRGKGSERLFVKTDPATGQRRFYPIKCHSEGADVGMGTLKACLRRFGISNDDFWL